MERLIGTVSRGVRAPIIRQGDDLVQIVADSVLKAAESEGFELRDKDVVAVTEAVVARAQGNYATIEQIAKDVHDRVGDDTVGIIFPILSRNRFSICLKGIAMGCKKVVLMLSYPSDEVGNHLITPEQLDESGVNPWSDVLTEERYRELFGYRKHQFTGVDYVEYYKKLIEDAHLLEEIGCFALVLEKIPAELAARVASELTIPVIGIGAGGGVDGQVLVMHDMLGINQGFSPRFLRRYANLGEEITRAVQAYIEDVKSQDFPNEKEQY